MPISADSKAIKHNCNASVSDLFLRQYQANLGQSLVLTFHLKTGIEIVPFWIHLFPISTSGSCYLFAAILVDGERQFTSSHVGLPWICGWFRFKSCFVEKESARNLKWLAISLAGHQSAQFEWNSRPPHSQFSVQKYCYRILWFFFVIQSFVANLILRSSRTVRFQGQLADGTSILSPFLRDNFYQQTWTNQTYPVLHLQVLHTEVEAVVSVNFCGELPANFAWLVQ